MNIHLKVSKVSRVFLINMKNNLISFFFCFSRDINQERNSLRKFFYESTIKVCEP